VHSLLARQKSTSPSTGFNLLYDASEVFMLKLDLVGSGSSEIDLEPRDRDVVLAYSILMDGHADTARRLTALYPLSAGTAYVRGRALVELGAFDEAVNLLKQAATGCRGEVTLKQRIRAKLTGGRRFPFIYTPTYIRIKRQIRVLCPYQRAFR
jgi:nuclear pore complex protein Nup160